MEIVLATGLTCHYMTPSPDDDEPVLMFETTGDGPGGLCDVAFVRKGPSNELEVVCPGFGHGPALAVPLEAVLRALKEAKQQLLLDPPHDPPA